MHSRFNSHFFRMFLFFCVLISTFFNFIPSYASTLPDSGDSSSVPLGTGSKSLNISTFKNALTINDANTLLDLNYQYEYSYDFELPLDSVDGFFQDRDGDGVLDDFYGSFSDDTDEYTSTSTRGFAYYLTSVRQLFYPSTDAYAYKINSKISNLTYSQANVKWAKLVFGTYSDLFHGVGAFGPSLVNGANNNNYVRTDYLDEPLYVGILIYYYDSSETDASFNINFDLDITYTSYSKNDYEAIESYLKSILSESQSQTDEMKKQTDEMKKQTDEMKKQTDEMKNIQNGYDSSKGDSMNESFSNSLDSYNDSQDSLFTAAQNGLSGFKFYNIAAFPALVTSLSFVTSLMTSMFIAMGGESGPFGVVLSVLFTVMIVSMAVGLYKYYVHRGGKGGGG